MTRQEAIAFLPLIKAFAEGKTIQFNDNTLSDPRWRDVDDPSFSHDVEYYRIKPESLEFELWVHPNKKLISIADMSVYTQWKKIRVCEITED